MHLESKATKKKAQAHYRALTFMKQFAIFFFENGYIVVVVVVVLKSDI